jgi:hypothetical protein
VVRERNEARLRMLQKKTRATTEEFNAKRRTVKTVCRQKKREREKLGKLQEEYEVKQSRKFYKGIWDIRKGYQPRIELISVKLKMETYSETGRILWRGGYDTSMKY